MGHPRLRQPRRNSKGGPPAGVYEYRARYYDQALGRFISEDPIGFWGGQDFYSYVGNAAPNAVDPLGLCKETCVKDANRRYIARYFEIKSESERRANEIALDWASFSFFTHGAEKFFTGPVVIKTGWTAIGTWTHRIVPVVELVHTGKAVGEEVSNIKDTYRKEWDSEMELQHDLDLCDKQ